MCKDDGLMLHGVPLIDNWKNHCRYYYSELFFEQLATYCNYSYMGLQILKIETYKFPHNLVVCALSKRENLEFITEDKFNQIQGIVDSKNTSKTGNYTVKKGK